MSDNSRHGNSNQRRQILTEEEYSCTLQKIITRDYFPSLTSLNRDASILQKRSEGDVAGAVAIRRAARAIAEHEALEKSIEQEEEREALRRGNNIRKRPRPLKEESLDGFHTRVTSEDNADFEETMKLESQAKRQEMDLVYNNHPSNRPLQLLEHGTTNSRDWQRLSYDEQRLSRLDPSPLMASDEFMPRHQTMQTNPCTTTTDVSTRNTLFFTPNHLPQDGKHMTKSTTTTLMITNNDERTISNNTIMPPPVFDPKIGESSLPLQLIPYEYKAKPTESSKEKRIIPSNTRFEYQNESRLISSHIGQSPLSSLEDEYNNGQLSTHMTTTTTTPGQNSRQDILNYDTESSNATTDLDDISISSKSIQMEREARRRNIEQERNSYVNMTPIILPGKGRDASPLMTFGTIASTPLVSSHAYEPSKTFIIPEQDTKEKLAQSAQVRLKQKSERFKCTRSSISSSNSTKSQPSTPSSSIIMDRHKSLTPAAQALLQQCTTSSSTIRPEDSSVNSTYRILSSSLSNARMKSGFASALRTSYTPKPLKKKDSSRRTKMHPKDGASTHVYKTTPLIHANKEKDEMKLSMTTTNSNGTIEETTRGLLKF